MPIIDPKQPAFPSTAPNRTGIQPPHMPGMSLRTWAAFQCLNVAGQINMKFRQADGKTFELIQHTIAMDAVSLADKILEHLEAGAVVAKCDEKPEPVKQDETEVSGQPGYRFEIVAPPPGPAVGDAIELSTLSGDIQTFVQWKIGDTNPQQRLEFVRVLEYRDDRNGPQVCLGIFCVSADWPEGDDIRLLRTFWTKYDPQWKIHTTARKLAQLPTAAQISSAACGGPVVRTQLSSASAAKSESTVGSVPVVEPTPAQTSTTPTAPQLEIKVGQDLANNSLPAKLRDDLGWYLFDTYGPGVYALGTVRVASITGQQMTVECHLHRYREMRAPMNDLSAYVTVQHRQVALTEPVVAAEAHRLYPLPTYASNLIPVRRPGNEHTIYVDKDRLRPGDSPILNTAKPAAEPDCPLPVSPWHVITEPLHLRRLGKLGEEACELGARIFRTVIQGLDGLDPKDSRPNLQHLEDEIADTLAQISLCRNVFEMNLDRMETRAERKLESMDEWERLLVAEAATE